MCVISHFALITMTSNQKKYNSKNPLQRFLIRKFLKNIREFSKQVSGNKLLEVGSGEGFVLSAILEKQNFQATALDPNESALMLLKQRLPQVETRNGYVEKLPFDDNSFDIVVCCEVLEHLEDPKKALQELKRVGKEYFILSVPNEPWFSMANFLRGKNLSRWGCDSEHIQKWSFKKFLKFIGGELKIIKAYKSFPWTMVLAKK